MEQIISLQSRKIKYKIRRSQKARWMRLAVSYDGSCVVTVPRFFPMGMIDKFLRQKAAWIVQKIDYFLRSDIQKIGQGTKSEYLANKSKARELVIGRLAHFNALYGFSYQKISIRRQRTRWGSCSRQGNLSFNYKLALMPEKYADYVIVHELCHLQEFNHSVRFWKLVEKAIPDYRELRHRLKRHIF